MTKTKNGLEQDYAAIPKSTSSDESPFAVLRVFGASLDEISTLVMPNMKCVLQGPRSNLDAATKIAQLRSATGDVRDFCVYFR